MNLFKKYKTLWVAGIIVVIAILFIVNFSVVVGGVNLLLSSISSLVGGAMLAFILNLIMDPVEKLLAKTNNKFIMQHSRGLGVFISFAVAFALVAIVLALVIPNMVNAIRVLADEAPRYISEVEDLIRSFMRKTPALAEKADSFKIDWNSTFDAVGKFLLQGTGAVNSTVNVVTSVIGSFVNLFVIIVFACYVLADKERFVRLYYYMTDLFMKKTSRNHLTRDLRIINSSFKAFIAGELIEAAILSTMCIVGMWILRLPYATMIGILVGVINMIPMIGAFIGGGIGAFIIFTVSPAKCLLFVIFLCIIQQIESNIFFPRVVGNKVGLPGIYVMITIVVGGSLFGVLGMVLGVPLVASIYKILKIELEELRRNKEKAKASALHRTVAREVDAIPDSDADIDADADLNADSDADSDGAILSQADSKAKKAGA